MSKKKNNNMIYAGILLIVVIAVFGYYVYANDSNLPANLETGATSIDNSTTSSDQESSDTNPKNESLTYSGNIYYIKETDGRYEIYTKKSNEDEKLLYTDTDENEKIKFAKSMTNSGKILALISPSDDTFGGSLYLIKADASGNKEKIIDNFVSPQPPVISPDENKIAYILFSNAEIEYGFSLYTMSLDGNNKLKIDTDSTMISNPVFSQNAKSIAYLKNNAVYVSDTDGVNKKSVLDLSNQETLNSLNWDLEDKILVSIYDSNKNITQIVSIDTTDDYSQKTLCEFDGNIVDPIFVDNEYTKIAYLNSDTGYIELTDFSNNKINLIKATGLIKWLK